LSDNGTIVIDEPTEEKELVEKGFSSSDISQQAGYVGLLGWLAGNSDEAPPWWSPARDKYLRSFWKEEDHLGGAVNVFVEAIQTIPFKVVPRDMSFKRHIVEGQHYTRVLLNRTMSRTSPANSGWDSGVAPFINDYCTQDNGAWFFVDAPGDPASPLLGMPTRLVHLDSFRITRTGELDYPVCYTDVDGQIYKFHRTRLINMTSNPSPIQELFGVGFCAVSRTLNTAINFRDIQRFKMEKLGSRPRRAILIGDGIPVKAIESALQSADAMGDSRGYKNYLPIPVIGSQKQGIDLKLVDLASIPDGFDEMTSTQLGISTIALAFGVDPRTLSFAIGVTGQTKADAAIQHLKQRSKGIGTAIQSLERVINLRFLPPYLKIIFDFQDDAQDRDVAEIRNLRAEKREKDLGNGSISPRVARQLMVQDGDLSPEQFMELELSDGRLDDGRGVVVLFHSDDLQFKEMLTFPVASITDISTNDPNAVIPMLDVRIAELNNALDRVTFPQTIKKVMKAIAALQFLRIEYINKMDAEESSITEQEEPEIVPMEE